MTTSQSPAFNVFLTNPRRCAHHVYRTSACRSRPTSAARWFSNPSSRSFVNGRLFGSAHTRSWRDATGGVAARPGAEQPPATSAASASTALRQCERIQHPAFGRVLRQIVHRVREPERGRRVGRIELAGNDGASPPADTGEDRDVLLAVGSAVRDRLSHHARPRLELPQHVAVLCVYRLEPPLHR